MTGERVVIGVLGIAFWGLLVAVIAAYESREAMKERHRELQKRVLVLETENKYIIVPKEKRSESKFR